MIVDSTCKENKEQGTHSGLFTIPHCQLWHLMSTYEQQKAMEKEKIEKIKENKWKEKRLKGW